MTSGVFGFSQYQNPEWHTNVSWLYFITLMRQLWLRNFYKYMVSLPPANEIWGKAMFLHLSVILFTWGGAWLPSIYITGLIIRGSASRGVCLRCVCIQWGVGQTPYGILWDTVNKQAVSILLKCILVCRKMHRSKWFAIKLPYYCWHATECSRIHITMRKKMETYVWSHS